MPVNVESTLTLPGLSPVGGKTIEAHFDSACMLSDGELLALREIEQRLAIAQRLAACIHDPRDPSRVIHRLDEVIRRHPPEAALFSTCVAAVFAASFILSMRVR